ncbi:MAG: energy transducer TonB [Rhodanobacter sp.]
MSSASLVVPVRPHLDVSRIAGLSAAMALNLAILVVAVRPLASVPLKAPQLLNPIQQVRLMEAPPVVPPPPPIELKALPVPQAAPVVLKQTRTTPVLTPVVTSMPTEVSANPVPIATTPPTTATDISTPSTGSEPVPASLAYLASPLLFPAQARRQQMHGTVMLRVLVDETGKPVQVVIEQGSGYALLDRSAREQVLAHWLFRPAQVHGTTVRAWARVPVTFSLHGQ